MHAADQCSTHSAPLYYYCRTCSVPACPDCVTLEGRHRDHDLAHMRTLYSDNMALLQERIQQAQTEHHAMLEGVRRAEQQLVDLQVSREGAVSEIRNAMDIAAARVQLEFLTRSARLRGAHDSAAGIVAHGARNRFRARGHARPSGDVLASSHCRSAARALSTPGR